MMLAAILGLALFSLLIGFALGAAWSSHVMAREVTRILGPDAALRIAREVGRR